MLESGWENKGLENDSDGEEEELRLSDCVEFIYIKMINYLYT
jgi:hypothetical protein